MLELQERIFVSEYSIDNDIKKLREIIGKSAGLNWNARRIIFGCPVRREISAAFIKNFLWKN